MGDWDESRHPRADDGKFGEGASQATSKPAGKRKRGAKFDPSAHQKRIAKLRTQEARYRQASLKIKQQMTTLKETAKTRTPKQRAALKERFSRLKERRADLKAKADKVKTSRVAAKKELATARKEHKATRAAGRATAKTERAKAKPKAPNRAGGVASGNPRPDRVRAIVGRDPDRALFASSKLETGWSKSAELEREQFSDRGQKAVRAHMDNVLAEYGMHNKVGGLVRATAVEIRTSKGMGGSRINGLMWAHNGQIALSSRIAGALHEHSKLDAKGLKDLGQLARNGDPKAVQQLQAFNVMTHEAIHGHGPTMIGTHPVAFVEEVTTEMSARKVSADAHGMSVQDVGKVSTAYDWYIKPTVSKLVELSGKSEKEAHDALADASIRVRRMSTNGASPTDMQLWIAKSSLLMLGNQDSGDHNKMYHHMMDTADSE